MQRQTVWQFNFPLLFSLALQMILIAGNCRGQFDYTEVKTNEREKAGEREKLREDEGRLLDI